jgi:hypothetical protein
MIASAHEDVASVHHHDVRGADQHIALTICNYFWFRYLRHYMVLVKKNLS